LRSIASCASRWIRSAGVSGGGATVGGTTGPVDAGVEAGDVVPVGSGNVVGSLVSARATGRLSSGGGAVFVIEEHGAAVGVCGFNWIDPANRAGEIGYWLAESAQGRGLVTDGVARLERHAFDDLGLARLTIPVCVDNARSRAIPERLGFPIEGTLHHAEWLYDRFVDHVLYARVRGG
jgi:L-amino acid N-acyltransferase YncA